MPELLRLYLDQMFRLEVAEALRAKGHDVVRASEVGQARADDHREFATPWARKELISK
jgi:hypothetical protein